MFFSEFRNNTTAPCDSFKARSIEISLLTYLLTYLLNCRPIMSDIMLLFDDVFNAIRLATVFIICIVTGVG